MTVKIPIRTRSQAHGARSHWAVTATRRRQERETTALFLSRAVRPKLPCVVTLVRIGPRPLDDDNLRGSLKSVRDQVAVWLGLPTNRRGHAEDRDPRVHWAYKQGKGKPGEYAVIVEVNSAAQSEVDYLRSREEWRGVKEAI